MTWLLLVWPAHIADGASGVEASVYAAVLCLLPSALSVLLARRGLFAGGLLSGVVCAMALRLAVVLIGAVAVCVYRPVLPPGLFLILLAPFYFVTLVVETRHLMGVVGAGRNAVGSSLGS